MKKAIILAAGSGIRLRKYHSQPKCLLKFGNKKITIIQRLYDILKKKNILDIVIVVNFVLGSDSPSESEFLAADLNSDGVLNILDVVILSNLILGI